MSRSKADSRIFAFNLILDIFRYMAQITYSFVVPKLILNSYGIEVTGLITSISQIMTYLMLVEAGLSKSVIVALYRPLANQEYQTVSKIVSTSRHLYNKISVFFIGAVVAAGFIYPMSVKTETLAYGSMFLIFLIIGFGGAFEFLSVRKYSVLMQANKQSGILSAIIAFHLILQCIIVTVLIRFKLSIIIVEAVVTASYIVRPLICFLYCRKRYAYIDRKAPPDKASVGNQRDAMLHQILNTIQPGVSVVTATFLLPMDTVGVLSLYMIVANGIYNILSAFNTVTPIFGHMLAKGQKDKFGVAFMQFDCFACFIFAIIFAVLFAVYEPFELLYSGRVIPFLALLCAIRCFLRVVRIPQEIILNTTGWYRGTRRYAVVQTVLMVGASVSLGLIFGVWGIIIGDIISQIYRSIEMLVHCMRKVNLPVWPAVKRRLSCVCCAAAAYPFLMRLRNFVPPLNGYGEWILYLILCCLCASVICLFLFIVTDRKELLEIYRVRIAPVWKRVRSSFSAGGR